MALFRRKTEVTQAVPPEPPTAPPRQPPVPTGELVPIMQKPRSDAYTLMLILSFLFFGTTIYVAGKELHEIYGWTGFGLLTPYEEKLKQEYLQKQGTQPGGTEQPRTPPSAEKPPAEKPPAGKPSEEKAPEQK